MNYYGGKELAAAFRTVRQNTVTIAEEIGEEHYGSHLAPGMRTVAETLLHVALIPRVPYQIHFVDHLDKLEGFNFWEFMGGLIVIEKKPHTKEQVIGLLKEEGDRFATFLDGLSDEFLAEKVAMVPGMGVDFKTRFEMLLGVKEHEMHHRGQLMVTERMLGITPHITRRMEARLAAMHAAKAGN